MEGSLVAAAVVAAAAVAATTAGATTAAAAVAATAAGATAATTTVAATTAAVAATAGATTAVAAAAGATATTAAEAAWALFTRTSLVHHDRTAFERLPIHAIDRRLRFSIGAHFDETEAFGATGVAIHHDFGRCHGTKLRKRALQRFITNAVGQIAHV